MTQQIDLTTILAWGEPKRVRAQGVEKDLLKAMPNAEFSLLWKNNKEALKAAGINWTQENGQWLVCWWRAIPAAEAQAKADSLAASKATDADIVLPVNKGLAYLGYQKAGIKFALGRAGTLIGDEMGLGKTIQAIGLINADPSIKKILIICPASLKLNWARELRKWLTRPLSIGLVGSGLGWGMADIRLINYEMLSKHAENVTGAEFDLVVVDESHRIKNPKAQCTKVFAAIKAKRRVAMTGTPILNRPIELYSTLLWLDPARWTKKKSYFERRYCGAFMGQWGWVNDGASNLDELQEILRTSVMVRRLKGDVLKELPAKQRQVIELEGDASAKKAAKAEMEKWAEYKEAIELAQAKVAAAGDDTEAYAAAVAELKEATGVAFEEMSLVRHQTAVAKVPMVLDFVTEILEDSDKKIVIFAHHQDVIESLRGQLAAYGAVKLVGGMSNEAKQEAVDAFQKQDNVRVFIGSTHAAGVGITLTASSHVVFAELDWTPGRVTQAEDRCHRIGQHDSVLVQHLVLAESLDAYMAGLIVAKQGVIKQALDEEAKPVEAKPVGAKEVKTVLEVEVKEAQPGALTELQIQAAHQAMKMLAGKCDGARALDDRGFNKIDTAFGHKLADQNWLSQKQAVVAAKLANKYRRQLPQALLDAIKGDA